MHFAETCRLPAPKSSWSRFKAAFPVSPCSRTSPYASDSFRTSGIAKRMCGLLRTDLDLGLSYLDGQIRTAAGFLQPGNVYRLDASSHQVHQVLGSRGL